MIAPMILALSNRTSAMPTPALSSSDGLLREEWRAYWLEYQTAVEMVDEVEFFEALQTLGGWYHIWDDCGPMVLCLAWEQANQQLPIALRYLAEQGIVAIVTATGRGLARRNKHGALQDLQIEIAHRVYRLPAGGGGWTITTLTEGPQPG